jgi:NAD(P)-dependent dehydrogenase (short-subunit alcohol dehydrogenase family)
MPIPIFDATKEIPDLSGKIILITGGTAGLGYETAVSFAAHNPGHIFFTGRSQPSADKLIKEVNSKYPSVPITFVKCDLASLDSVRDAAKDVVSKTDRLDIVMANAGVMALGSALTKDGYEIQFGTNHVGQALLVKLLTPLLESTAKQHGDVRVVWNTSLGHQGHPPGGIIFDKLKTTQKDIFFILGNWIRYGQSKLANLLYAREYAKHHPSITSVSIHPGISATGLVTSLGFFDRWFVYITTIGQRITPEQCSWNQQWAATAPLGKGNREVETGTYYEPVGIKGKLVTQAANDELAEKLWEWTQKELEGYTL